MAVMGGIIGKIMTAAAKDEMDIYGKVQKSPFDCMTVCMMTTNYDILLLHFCEVANN